MKHTLRGQSGFTLTELFTCLIACVIFMALLVSGLSNAREAGSRNISCMNRLRQWGTITATYLNDFDGWFFNRDKLMTPEGEVLGTRHWMNWFQYQGIYYSSTHEDCDDLFKCPSSRYIINRADDPHYGVMRYGVTAYRNNPGSGADRLQARLSKLTLPSETILMSDSKNRNQQDPHGRGYWTIMNQSAFPYDFAVRHNNGANVLFVGGNVSHYETEFDPNTGLLDGQTEGTIPLNTWIRDRHRSMMSGVGGILDF